MLRTVLGVVIGAAVGVLWARLTRCTTGACPLTSNWWTAGLIGATFGLWIAWTPAGTCGREQLPTNSGVTTASDVAATQPSAHGQRDTEASAMVKHIDSLEQFEREVLQADKPVLVDFYAVWCGPCRLVAPVMEQLAEELAGRAYVAKVDVDRLTPLAAKYGIQAIPTVILFDSGRPVATMVGVRSKKEYLQAVGQVASAAD